MPTFVPPFKRRNYGRGHGYRDANNQKVPGVTTILSNGVPKPALVGWAANTTAGYAVDHWDELGDLTPSKRLDKLKGARYADLDAAAKRGTEVHALAEKLVVGQEITVPDELAGHVDSYVQFLDEWDVQAELVEFVVMSPKHGYAGTADLYATITNPEDPDTRLRALLDIKTSRSGIFGETALQLSAYRFAEQWGSLDGKNVQPSQPVDLVAAIHVRADGYDLIPVRADEATFLRFRYVQQVAEFSEHSREYVLDALDPPEGAAA